MVFPAHAGVILVQSLGKLEQLRFSRTRGGDPIDAPKNWNTGKFSRTRGGDPAR